MESRLINPHYNSLGAFNLKPFYIGVWTLLALALAVVVTLSFNEGVASDLHLRTAGFATLARQSRVTVASKHSSPQNCGAAKKTPNSTKPKSVEKAPLDTTAKSILFIGDSMLEGLGMRLAAYAKENGHTLVRVIWYSSTTKVWGGSPRLKRYIAQFKPNYIFVCLGANELFVSDIRSKRQKYLTEILSQIGNIPYVWIGPPNWKKDTGINDMLRDYCAPGTFFYSGDGHYERQKDGAHPTTESAAKWMDRVCTWVMTESAHPILLKKPKAGKAYCRTLVLQPSDR